MKSWALLVGLVLGAAAAARADALPLVFEQPPADPFAAGTFFSDRDHPREAATPFSLAHDSAIASLAWWGGYFGIGPVPSSPTSSFVILLYESDALGAPRVLPLHEIAVSASVTEVAGAVQSFRFEATLPGALDLPGGVPLWLAIVDVDPTRPTFAWRKTTEAGVSSSRAGAGLSWSEAPGLASFRLEGTTVPEPGTAALAALGLSVLGLRARRRGATPSTGLRELRR
jgi:hypothetical protein